MVEKERDFAAEQFKDKPAQAIEKIVDGKIEKYFSEHCLVDQPFVKQGDPNWYIYRVLQNYFTL